MTKEASQTRDVLCLRRRALDRAARRDVARKELLVQRGLIAHADEPHHSVRRALAIADALAAYPIELGEDDQLVGRYGTAPLSMEERAELARCREMLRQIDGNLRFGPGSGGTGSHRAIDYELLLRVGIRGVLAEVGAQEAALDPTQPEYAQRSVFLRASRIALEGLLTFTAHVRQAVVAARDVATDPADVARWSMLAGILARVPEGPASTFHEALQSVWLVQFATLFDDGSISARVDQYLLPYYDADLDAGRITRERAEELIRELFWRSNEVYADWPETIMVGGRNAQGQAVHNDLTELCIAAIAEVGLINPNVGVCYRPDMSDDFLLRCLDPVARGLSSPAFYNDRVIAEGLVEAGYRPEDARVYINSTCVEITPVASSNVQVADPVLYPAKALALLLNGGCEFHTDDRYLPDEVGAATIARWRRPVAEGGLAYDLTSLTTWDAFLAAYWRALEDVVEACVVVVQDEALRRTRYGSNPMVSCFIRDCMARGLDASTGGARYNDYGAMAPGFSTTVDSLLAIRQAVYVDGRVTLAELRDALRRDFAGDEPLRLYLRNRCPKYGRGDASADALAVKLYERIRQQLARFRTCLGGRFHIGVYSGWGGRPHGAHVNRGLVTGATPDGRHAGEPLSECIGPAPGVAQGGLTALIRSVTEMDHRYGLGGISVNVRLDPGTLASEEDRRKLVALLREFMARGGFELQLNVVDTATLRDAQAHPERHAALTVRVAGYSDYFTNLDERVQEEVISRAQMVL